MASSLRGAVVGDDVDVVDDDIQRRAPSHAPQHDYAAPLRDQDVNVTHMTLQDSAKAAVAASKPSVLHRPRPKPADRLSKQASSNNIRSSLFSIDTGADPKRPSSFFGGLQQDHSSSAHSSAVPSPNTTTVHESAEDASSFDNASSLPSIPPHDDVQHSALNDVSAPTTMTTNSSNTTRHSFYGLDQLAHDSPSNTLDTSMSSRQPSIKNSTLNGDSGSGSRSSFGGASSDLPQSAARQGHNPAASYASAYRQSFAPYASSRAASVYGATTAESLQEGHSPASATVPMVPLLDHSHLKVGPLATLLSQEKTLDLYRANARKTSDPDVQFEFAIFCLEVVGDMDAANHQQPSKESAGNSSEAQIANEKKSALVSESIALLSKLATRGHVKSQYFLADCYTQGVGTPNGKRDYAKAFPLFVLAGKHGHAEACFRAGQCCEFGWGCRKDANKAVQLYKRGAIFGHPESMHRLGVAELNGELGLSKKPKDGVKWLKRAADLADQVDPPQPVSLHELALLHEKGIENVIFKDEEYAAELLARAAELQYAPSAYKLGECYEYGKMSCPKDSALSIHYYNIAAQQNHPQGCFALTAWYLVGSPGVLPQSDTEAYLWALKAAEMGLAKAQYAVGYFTETGTGTYKDARDAIKWYQKAARQGDKRAVHKLREAGKPIPVHDEEHEKPPPPPSNSYKPPHAAKTASSKKRLKGKSADKKGSDYKGSASFAQQSLSSRSEGGHDIDVRRYDHETRPAVPRRRSVSVPDAIWQEAGKEPMLPPLPLPHNPQPHFMTNGSQASFQSYQSQPPLQGYPVIDRGSQPPNHEGKRFTPRSSSADLHSQASSASLRSGARPLPPGAGHATYDQAPRQNLNGPLPRMPSKQSMSSAGPPPPPSQFGPDVAYTSRMLPPATLAAVQAGQYAQAPNASSAVSANGNVYAGSDQAGKRQTLQREQRRKDEKDCVIM